jgi:hypothetical protein
VLVGRCLLGGGGGPAAGQDVEADVAALLGPGVVLRPRKREVPPGQDSTDEADDGLAVGEDADDVGAAADLPVEPLDRLS